MSTLMLNAEELVAENAKLRDKLHRTEEQRVLDEIVQHSLNEFLSSAKVQLSLLQENESTEEKEKDDEEKEGTCKATSTATQEVRKSVAETLAQLTHDKLELEKQLTQLQTHKVKALNTQVEQLTHDKEALLMRVKELESKAKVNSNSNDNVEEQIPSVKEEVKLLRQSEQLLQRQLQTLQSHQMESVFTLQTTFSEHVNSLHTLPELTEQLATLETSLQNAKMAQHVTSFVADEDAKRYDALHEVLHSQLRDITSMYSNKLHVLQSELVHRTSETEKLQELKNALTTQLSNLQSEFDAYKAKYNADSESEYSEEEQYDNKDHNEEEMAGMVGNINKNVKRTRKRRRNSEHSAEIDTQQVQTQLMQMLHDANSKRSEFIRFWYEGKDTITKLESEVKTLKENTQAHERNEVVIRDLQKSKSVLSLELVNLTQEIDKLRKVNQDQRVQYAGLCAERDYLLAIFTSALIKSFPLVTTSASMEKDQNDVVESTNEESKPVNNETNADVNELLSPEALRECCKTIRNAAAAQAAASAAIVIDESALQAAKRTAYELQNSVSQLEKRKDNLLKVITLREDRLKALLEREVMTLNQILLQKEKEQNNININKNNNISVILEYVEQAINDILELIQTESSDSNNMNSNEEDKEKELNSIKSKAHSHIALQQRLTTSQEKLLQSQKRVQQLLIEKDDLVNQINILNEFKSHETQTQQTQIKLLQEGNNTLTSQVLSLQTQVTSWQKHYANIVQLTKQILYGLSVTLNLLQAEQTHNKECQELIKEERQAMVSLLQREAEMWSVASTNVNNEENTNTIITHFTAAQGVVESLQRLQTYMDETINMLQLHNEQDKTKYIVRLAHALHEHESVIQHIRNTFTQLTQEQSKMLVNKLLAAQENWNSTWESKYKQMAREQEIIQTSQLAQSTLWERLEQRATHTNNEDDDDDHDDKKEVEEMEKESDEDENKNQQEWSNASAQETLSVIKRFLISAKAQLEQEEQQHHQEEEQSSDEEEEEEEEEEQLEENEASETDKETEQTVKSIENKQSKDITKKEDEQLHENEIDANTKENDQGEKQEQDEEEKDEELDENEERVNQHEDDDNKSSNKEEVSESTQENVTTSGNLIGDNNNDEDDNIE